LTDLKTLIQINRSLWGKVKDYATVKNLTLYSTVELLLQQALIANGYHVKTEEHAERSIEREHDEEAMNNRNDKKDIRKQSIC
jgi:hypothetical protein